MKKTILALGLAVAGWGSVLMGAPAGSNEVSGLLQKGLFEEEANQNLEAAIAAYQAVIAQTDKTRQYEATAIFRLGECYRKQGDTNDANVQFKRILKEFADQKPLVKLSEGYLGTAAAAVTNGGGWQLVLDGPNAAANVEALRAETRERARVLVQQLFPGPVINALVESLYATEQQLVSLHHRFGDTNPEVQAAKLRLAKIQEQIDEQIQGILSRKRVAGSTAVGTEKDLEDSARERLETRRAEELESMKRLVQERPDMINVADYQHGAMLPIRRAILEDNTNALLFLITHGADVNIESFADFAGGFAGKGTPLMWAVDEGKFDMARILVEHGADINAKGQTTALNLAVERDSLPAVKFVLANGADINLKARNGESAVGIAVQKNFPAMATFLIERGAIPDSKSLEEAAKSSLSLTKLFLEHGAKVDGSLSLYRAIESKQYDILKLLLGQHPDVNHREASGYTPLMQAIDRNDQQAVEILLSHGADANNDAPDGKPLICWASRREATQIVKDLVQHGAQVDAREKRTLNTALILAVTKTNLALIQILIGGHADVNATNVDGNTPLHLAVDALNGEIVKLLVEKGAEVNLRNGQRERPLDLEVLTPTSVTTRTEAAQRIKDYLREHGALASRDTDYIYLKYEGREILFLIRDIAGRNRYTLLDAIHYMFWYAVTDTPQISISVPLPGIPKASSFPILRWNFPDLRQIKIIKPNSGEAVVKNFEEAAMKKDCAADMGLDWGDTVEIAGRDHALRESRRGLDSDQIAFVSTCLKRQVQIQVHGEKKEFTLKIPQDESFEHYASKSFYDNLNLPPRGATNAAVVAEKGKTIDSFDLTTVVNESGMVLASSDLKRVRVTRRATGTEKEKTFEVDVTARPEQQRWMIYDLKLEDGDVIEIPNKEGEAGK